jgi:hypothetical protein
MELSEAPEKIPSDRGSIPEPSEYYRSALTTLPLCRLQGRVTQHYEYHVFFTFNATYFGFLLAIQEV